jgi:hypothetical protein
MRGAAGIAGRTGRRAGAGYVARRHTHAPLQQILAARRAGGLLVALDQLLELAAATQTEIFVDWHFMAL